MDTKARRIRIANACDLCKLRKMKCSGTTPCTYCVRRQQGDACRYTVHRRKLDASGSAASTPSVNPLTTAATTTTAASSVQTQPSTSGSSHIANSGPQLHAHDSHVFAVIEEHEETEVPREARLLCDPQGKLIFLGDCAPLSFFQTVRRLVTSRVDAHAFAPETSGYSALENAHSRPSASAGSSAEPPAIKIAVEQAVSAYHDVTTGLIDLFDNTHMLRDITYWASQPQARDESADFPSAVNYLVLAIGCQKSDEATAQTFFDYARDTALASLTGNLGVGSVQVFILVTFYMLGAGQINGAFLFFGIAVRAAFSIGIHRTAVNSRFGLELHQQRDRMWKSLRVVDLFLSTSMGRPPATSDIDCTVPYRATGENGREAFDLLNASVQIFLIIEAIVVEVYSRRKISPRLTEGISRELRDWSTRWLQPLKNVIEGNPVEHQPGMANGACQILSSYYYAVILVSRPFLMVELHRRLSEGYPSPASSGGGGAVSGRSKLADACIDAAILMVEPIQDLIERGLMTRRAPVVVSWLFASSLVLGLGLLGQFGRIIEKHCRASIAALEYFADVDSHAVQYALIAKSLLATALEHLEKTEIQDRLKRTESSSQLFGLVPLTPRHTDSLMNDKRPSVFSPATSPTGGPDGTKELDNPERTRLAQPDGPSPRFSFDFESTFLGFTESLPGTSEFSILGDSLDHDSEQTFGALNLFPLLESDGHIDLANYF
ncbi:hypothetical protein B0H63DRAFT_173185 [Podospora didyma]|uniref:Zn(2)-C6 fungal-type domain-containing protein n=1 Tax=Podospora didyma TaxID=330526 RepID=A0AAE0NNV1_9PEZI|nr:hypothetical protein B0H63DRAFT_173185 [Podospora didyma]